MNHKKLILLFVIPFIIYSMIPTVFAVGGDFAGGDGSLGSPYLIENADQFNRVRNHLDKHFRLIGDTNLISYIGGEGWEPIGNRTTPFTGTFDGSEDGHVITNLTINRSSTEYVGLFGYTGSEAEIRNIRLVNVNVTGRDYVGGLIGWNNGQITNSYVTGSVTGKDDIGGLVGQSEDSITGSFFRGTVTADSDYTGGLVGDNNGTITNCYAEAIVTSAGDYVGGLAGGSFNPVTDSYSTGTVTGDDYVGGLVGWSYTGNNGGVPCNGSIADSYSTSSVTATGWDIGGLVGSNYGTISGSYATGAVTSTDVCVGGLVGSNYTPILNSYATGNVQGKDAVGGLIGYNDNAVTNCYSTGTVQGMAGRTGIGGLIGDTGGSANDIVTNCFWDTESSGKSTSVEGTGKTAIEMKQQNTYVGWDFDDIWGINNSDNNEYPFLRWQGYVHGPINVPPVLSATGASSITATAATLDFRSDKAGTYYYLVYSEEDAAPNTATIRAQGDAVTKGTGAAVAAANAIQITGLTASTTYKGYVIVEDGSTISNVSVISFTTTAVPIGATISPVLCTLDLRNPGNVSTNITWGNATTVSAITCNSIPLTTPSDYNVNGNTLTIIVSYLQSLNLSAGDRVGFEISFDVGNTVTLILDVVQTYGGGNDDSSSSSPAPTPTYKADVSGTGISKLTLPVNINKNAENAAVNLREKAKDIFIEKETTVITIPSIPDVNSYTVEIPTSYLIHSERESSLNLAVDTGSIMIPNNMLYGISKTEGKMAGITIGKVDKSILSDEIKAIIGNRPLVELNLTLDGVQTDWNNPGAQVTISLPYTPTVDELANPDYIVVWYIDGAGNVVSVPNGRYDSKTRMVRFTTTHFSHYAVAYVHRTFDDLESVPWAKESVEVLASKGTLEGISEKEYAPQQNITRADFLTFLVRTLAINAEVNEIFDDISENAYYYKEIGIAKKIGITSGTGNNKFSPDAYITRQDVMVLTERALRMLGKIKNQDLDLGEFADKSLVADYAVNGVASVVKEGLIIGNGNKINPLDYMTRAETAVFLHRIYNKY